MSDNRATHQSEPFEEELRYHTAALLELVAEVCVAIRFNASSGTATRAIAAENVRQLSDSLHNLDMLGRALRGGDPDHLAWAARLQRAAWERDETSYAQALVSTYGVAVPRATFRTAVGVMRAIENTAARCSRDLSGAAVLRSPAVAGMMKPQCGAVSPPAGQVMSDTSHILKGADAAWTLAIELLRTKGHDDAADELAAIDKAPLRLRVLERSGERGLPRDWADQLDEGAADVDEAFRLAHARLKG